MKKKNFAKEIKFLLKKFFKKILKKKLQKKNFSNFDKKNISSTKNVAKKIFTWKKLLPKFFFDKNKCRKKFCMKICTKENFTGNIFYQKSYHWWKNNWHISLKAEIRHLGSTHKSKIIQGVFDLVGIGTTWNNIGWPQYRATFFYPTY